MKTQAELTHPELYADLAATLKRIDAERDDTHQKAERLRNAASDAHTKATADAKAAFAEEHERRLRDSQKKALDTLVPLVKAWLANDGRAETKAIAEAYTALDADAKRDTGAGLSSSTLVFCFATISCETHPDRRGWWCQPVAYSSAHMNSPSEISHRAGKAALAGNVAATREELLRLESAIEAGGGQGLTDNVERRLEIVMTGGSPRAVEAALAALKAERREEDRARVQNAVDAHDKEEARKRAADGYGGVVPATLGAALDQALNRVMGRPRAGA